MIIELRFFCSSHSPSSLIRDKMVLYQNLRPEQAWSGGNNERNYVSQT